MSAGEQRFLALAGLVVAILSCVAGWLALRPEPSPKAVAPPATTVVLPTNPPVVLPTQPTIQPPGPAVGGQPLISSVSPSSGRAGTQATLSASGFAPGEHIRTR